MLGKKRIRLGMAGLFLATVGMSAQGAVLFDIDGSGGAYTPTTTEGIDIFPGNALAVGAVPIAVGQDFQLHYQAEVNFVSQNGGATQVPIPVGGNNASFEITIVVVLNETVQSLQDPDMDGFNETASFAHTDGTFTIYYDDTPDADDLTGNFGTGYDDGVIIASGTVRPGSANFTINENLPVVSLDRFGDDNLNGVLTLDQGFGAANIQAEFEILSLNQDFFPNLDLASLTMNTTLETPFDNNNPSISVNGNVPDYGSDGVNGLVNPLGLPEDFHFEADGNASFQQRVVVPVPGTLALVGLGLLAFGFRRKT